MAHRIWVLLCKLIQRKTYSCLSTNYGLWFTFTGLCVIIVTIFHFGEVAMQWSMIRYAGNFKLIRAYDNIAGKSFEYRLCLPQPIDIVYTWVNGSDPKLITELNAVKVKLKQDLNASGNLYASRAQRTKTINLNVYKWKDMEKCPVLNCVPAMKVALSGLPRHISLSKFKTLHANISTAMKVEFWQDDLDVAFVTLLSYPQLKSLLSQTLMYKGQKLNISEVFYTSTIKTGHRKMSDALMIYDVVKATTTKEEIQDALEANLPNSVASISLYPDNNVGVIHFKNEKYVTTIKALSKHNLTLNGKPVRLFPVTYIWKPVTISLDNAYEDVSGNRFADNNELKYSLRSVEKFAPWVRKIFIVTNGQIPSWLNIDHPRITLVTHKEIFQNKSHLPTFSSPAIESHIHRIPGLSKKFIYMNDDVFFGDQVWPDDFYTHSNGHKVFLSWGVPNCNEGCPSSWLNDKYCDKACNVSACDWDGGDCLHGKGKSGYSLELMRKSGLYQHNIGEYCSDGCAHSWIGDRYCDANCNKPSCGFDAGDCGLHKFNTLYSLSLSKDMLDKKNLVFRVPDGTLSMFLNFTNVFDSVKDGNHNDAIVLRSAVFSQKHKLISLTFYKNFSQSIAFQILGHKFANGSGKSVLFFNVTVNTMNLLPDVNQAGATKLPATTVKVAYPVKLYNDSAFTIFPQMPVERKYFPKHLANLSLPSVLRERLDALELEYRNEEVTELGYNISKGNIYGEYLSLTQSNMNRKLLWLTNDVPPAAELRNPYSAFFSFLPWEKGTFLKDIKELQIRDQVMKEYERKSFRNRRLFDTFSSSLLHVSRLYNKAFGYKVRKVPAHMPHLVDRDVIYEMHDRFWPYFDATSSHKVRHPHDMQFAFSFNYYLIGVKQPANMSTIFNQVDTDNSGSLSDRELRSLVAILYELPLSKTSIKDAEEKLKNCSLRMTHANGTKSKVANEKYFDPSMPLVTKKLFLNCHELWRSAVKNATKERHKYKHEITGEDDVTFKMIRNNISYVLFQLDWIRKNRKKFICLNDDLDHEREDTKTIRAILKDFYESLFPIPSKFELPNKYRNKFLYKEHLENYLHHRTNQTNLLNVVVFLIVAAFISYIFRRKCFRLLKWFTRFFPTRRDWTLDGDVMNTI